ncbi:MAG TPA: hypothetical protein VFW40_13385, partial [Capsulimonadaceae bacterium]|nr:hypothetical protein [Capsulimonadaceae bacterium]
YDDQGILSNASSDKGFHEPPANTPFPPYYGIKMVHTLARPGDQFIAATSDNDFLGAYADLRRDGYFALMLINKDPKNPITVHVSVANAQIGSTGYRYDYLPGAKDVTSSKIKPLGGSFTITVPAYGITDILAVGWNITQQP